MTAPVPALSTSADVEAVRRALMASRLTWGVHADRWGDSEWQREFWTEAATIAVAALSTPPTEGTTGHPTDPCPHGYFYGYCAYCTPSVPGAVGAGSAVKALADEWEAESRRLTARADEPDADEVRSSLLRESGAMRGAAIVLRAAIAQDADRTSRGGALGPLTDDERLHVMTEYAVDGKSWTDVERAINRVFAARATRSAPDDQAEGER